MFWSNPKSGDAPLPMHEKTERVIFINNVFGLGICLGLFCSIGKGDHMLVTSKEMLASARAGGYAIPSPDFVDSNSARAFASVAEELNAPIILSFAEVHLEQMALDEAAALGSFYAKKANVPVALHLDHGTRMDVIEEAIRLGFTSVMIDASKQDLDENIRRTKEAVDLAHAHGVYVEAEIGHVGADDAEGPHALSDIVYTEVATAKQLVESTNVDSLAVSIGTVHGTYKGTPCINFERLAELKNALEVPLVLHGGSGSGDDNLARCAQGGIAKVNLYTDFIVAARNAVYDQHPDHWLKMLGAGDEAMREVLRHYYKVLGCAK